MCEPTTIAIGMMALSTAAAGIQHKQTKDSAKQQEQAIKDGVERNNIQTQQQYEQNNQAAAQQQSERHREYLLDQGRLSTILAESGLQGATPDRILGENENLADADMATIEANRTKSNVQVASGAAAQRGAAEAQNAAIKRPSNLGTGLQIAGSLAGLESKYGSVSQTYHGISGAISRGLGITQAPAPVTTAKPKEIN